MGIKTYNPYTPSRRHMTGSDFAEITKLSLIHIWHQVKTKVYSGYRHEIHNYKAIKDEVEAGILAFMDGIAQ